MTSLQWIGDMSWTINPTFHAPRYMPYLEGTLGLTVHRGDIPGFKEFLLKIRPHSEPDNTHENSIVSNFVIITGTYSNICGVILTLAVAFTVSSV